MKTKSRSAAPRLGPIILALTMLINPTVKVFDLLPDFIGCFIIMRQLTYAANRAPYFEEARTAFKNLGLLSIAKIPAFFIISYARANNVQDYDTAVLFTLVFVTVETVLLCSAVRYLFLGAFYLGERTEAEAIISPFPLGRRGKRFMTPEQLRALTFAFVGVKSALCLLPEMLLLTQSVDPGAYVQAFRPMRYYPYTIVLAVIAVFVFSIIYAKRACSYLRAIRRAGCFVPALDSLITGERVSELESKMKIKSVKHTLSLFIAAAILSLEVCFADFSDVNLLPHFIYGALLMFALISCRRHTKLMISAPIVAGAYCIAAGVTYGLQISFIDEFGYESLVKGVAAKETYLPVIILSIVEFVLLVALIVLAALMLRRVVLGHTALETDSDKYSTADAQYHKRKLRGLYIWGALATVSGLSKVIDVAQKYFASLTLVATDDGIGVVSTGLVPWFNMVVLLCSAIYIGYTLYLFSTLGEDVELKYS